MLPLFVAEMDVHLAPPIRAALERALADGDTGYPELPAYQEAFADYAQIVARIQQRQDKQAWLDRVSAIDEFEHVVDAEWDRAESDRVRNLADESQVLASIYLDEIAPLAKSLKRRDAA